MAELGRHRHIRPAVGRAPDAAAEGKPEDQDQRAEDGARSEGVRRFTKYGMHDRWTWASPAPRGQMRPREPERLMVSVDRAWLQGFLGPDRPV